MRLEIEEVLEDPSGLTLERVAARGPVGRRVATYLVAGLVLALVAVALTSYLRPLPLSEPGPVIRFDYQLPEDQAFNPNLPYPFVAVSPDGDRIAYVANSQLYLWNLEQGDALPVSGTMDAPLDPVFSPTVHGSLTFPGPMAN